MGKNTMDVNNQNPKNQGTITTGKEGNGKCEISKATFAVWDPEEKGTFQQKVTGKSQTKNH